MQKNLVIVKHPLIETYITEIRNKKTSFSLFRDYVDKLSMMLAYETGKELALKDRKIMTPMVSHTGRSVFENIVLVPILRAGLGMLYGFNLIFPEALISHIGIYRNEETLKPVKYYFKFPKSHSIPKPIVFILDPMLATGGSAICAIEELKKKGVKKILVVSLVSSVYGVREITKKHKDIRLYTCAVDKKLNSIGYIVPGLGDAGDRMFGT